MTRLPRLSLLLALAAALAVPSFASPFDNAKSGSYGIELAMNFFVLPNGDLERGVGLECNIFAGPENVVGFFFMNRDWGFFGMSYTHYFDFLQNRHVLFPLKIRAGGFSYFGEMSWGAMAGIGARGFYDMLEPFIGTGPDDTGVFGCVEALAEVVFHSKPYYESSLEFLPEIGGSLLSFIGDDHE